jgi:hypothetical protein
VGSLRGAMPSVTLDDPRAWAFATTLLDGATAELAGAAFDAHNRRATVAEPAIARALERLASGGPVVLPWAAPGHDLWLIAGAERNALDLALSRASRFVVPTWATFFDASHTPRLRSFDPAGNAVQQAGAALFPAGYYRWRSPRRHRRALLDRLNLWLDLEARRPQLPAEESRSYGDVLREFQTALATADWAAAEQCLAELDRRRLVAADNFAFLRLNLRAHHPRWRAIWEFPD